MQELVDRRLIKSTGQVIPADPRGPRSERGKKLNRGDWEIILAPLVIAGTDFADHTGTMGNMAGRQILQIAEQLLRPQRCELRLGELDPWSVGRLQALAELAVVE